MTSPPHSGLHAAERRFTRSVLLGLFLMGLVALGGPLVSYRSDVDEMRHQFRSRVAREGRVYAQSLGLHLQLLKSELTRVALGVGPELRREHSLEDVQDLTGPNTGLFRQGIVLMDATGKARWSEPPDLLTQGSQLNRAWFQHLLVKQSPTVDAISPGASTFVVAVPIVRERQTLGVLAGLLDASADLPGARPTREHLTLLVLNRAGDLFVPNSPPDWALTKGFAAKVETLLSERGQEMETGRGEVFAWATPVPGTELRLVLAADETASMESIRDRLLTQLLVIVILQVGTLLLVGLYGRRVYRLFLEVERRAAEKETLAALGSAASLIAHEVKNSLNGLKVATGMLSPLEEQALAVRTLRGQIDRLAHLATSLLHFGKPPRVQRIPMDLPALVREVIEGLSVLPEAEEVQLDARLPEALSLDGDPLLLATALDNLVRNAMEAAVAAKDLGQVQNPEVRVSVRREDAHAVVDVEDNAGGPPAGFEQRLFEPFVTTKPKGVGLGLSMTRRAVEQQHGQLTFTRIPGGSRFSVRLPLDVPETSA
ncbi:sensor histidine kinase [Archangium primigenium]|uniref:sensor histidine kinase n=1 Tax=[Archangium] primigenium TaxID=2792470 RepID=UPI001958F868|nr:HAMP domain-containing sensor histidine kinase [Archangium primigenium]MBM7118963.1 HAMP domain-containing histidine kinase [Archangium primigenium]